jgi:hypothetical protein
VVVFLRPEDTISIGISLHGYNWGLQRLPFTCSPPQSDSNADEIVRVVLEGIARSQKAGEETSSVAANTWARTILKYAIKWGRADVWNKTVGFCGFDLDTAGLAVEEALHVYEIDLVKPGCVYYLHSIWLLNFPFLEK